MEIEKKPTKEIIIELTKLDQEIELLMLKYEKLRLEIIRRYPGLENSEEFKKKNIEKNIKL